MGDSRFRRRTVRALLTMMLGAALLASCSREPPKPVIGQPAPDFELTTLSGTKIRLRDLRGKVVLVNLWATWCPPCRDEMPSMVGFYQMVQGQPVEVVAVSEDRDPEALKRFVQQHGVTFPVGLDEGKKIYQLYRATGVPETHLIDRQGILRVSQIGPFDWTAPDVLRTVQEYLRR